MTKFDNNEYCLGAEIFGEETDQGLYEIRILIIERNRVRIWGLGQDFFFQCYNLAVHRNIKNSVFLKNEICLLLEEGSLITVNLRVSHCLFYS